MTDRSYLIWMIVPILPFALGFALLGLISDGDARLLASQATPGAFDGAALHLRFFNGLILYAAVALFHVCLCLGVMGYAALRILRLPARARRRSLTVLAVAIVILALVNAVARQPDFIGALTLTYRNVCSLLLEAGLVADLLPTSCVGGPLSGLAWLATAPYAAGLLAAAFTAALTATAYDGASSEAELLEGADLVDEAFKATALVLATSTIAMVFFYRLPLPVLAEDGLRDLVAAYGQGMAMFWGVAFTLTLGAIFGPSALLVRRKLAESADRGGTLVTALAERSTLKRVRDALTMLAPLLIGSAGSVLEMLAGVLG